MALTKKDFQSLAESIHWHYEGKEDERELCILAVIQWLRLQNPRFDEGKFRRVCEGKKEL